MMVQAIIFDLGDVFLNKNQQAKSDALASLGLTKWNNHLIMLEKQFETGEISRKHFVKALQGYTENASEIEVIDAWNASVGDFPLERLEFLQKLSATYRLFLLSNTDPIHIDKFEEETGISFYGDFYRCFEKIYYSHETGVRKPDTEAYSMLAKNHGLQPKRTLVVDDNKVNTDVAEMLGFKTWTLKKDLEDVTELFERRIVTLETAP